MHLNVDARLKKFRNALYSRHRLLKSLLSEERETRDRRRMLQDPWNLGLSFLFLFFFILFFILCNATAVSRRSRAASRRD